MSLTWTQRVDTPLLQQVLQPDRYSRGAAVTADRAVIGEIVNMGASTPLAERWPWRITWLKVEPSGAVTIESTQSGFAAQNWGTLNSFNSDQVAGSVQGKWVIRTSSDLLYWDGAALTAWRGGDLEPTYQQLASDLSGQPAYGGRIWGAYFDGEDLLLLVCGWDDNNDFLDLMRLSGEQWSLTRMARQPYGPNRNGYISDGRALMMNVDGVATPVVLALVYEEVNGTQQMRLSHTYDDTAGWLVPGVNPWGQHSRTLSHFDDQIILADINNDLGTDIATITVIKLVGSSFELVSQVQGSAPQHPFSEWAPKGLHIRGSVLTYPGFNGNLEEYGPDAQAGPYYDPVAGFQTALMPYSHRDAGPSTDVQWHQGEVLALGGSESGGSGSATILTVYEATEVGTSEVRHHAATWQVEWVAPPPPPGAHARVRGRRGFFDRV